MSRNAMWLNENDMLVARDRQMRTLRAFKDTIRAKRDPLTKIVPESPKIRYLSSAQCDARMLKRRRSKNKEGTTAFTASLLSSTTTRLKQAPRGLQSANLEALVCRGWLWGDLWAFMDEQQKEIDTLNNIIDIYKARGEEE